MKKEHIEGFLLKNTKISKREIIGLMNYKLDDDKTIWSTIEGKNYDNAEDILSHVCGLIEVPYMKDIPINDIPVDLIKNLPLKYATDNYILPFKDEGTHVTVLTSNPLDTNTLGNLRVLFGKKITPMVSTTTKIQDAVNKVYEKSAGTFEGLDEIDEDDDYDLEQQEADLLDVGEDDAPVIKLVNKLFSRAIKEKASDIHIEPYEGDVVVRFRIDGILYDVFKPSKRLQNAIISRIKVLGNLNIAEKRLPQDGRIQLKLAGRSIDVRLNTVPIVHGERLVMRLQDRSNVVLELEQLGFPKRTLDSLSGQFKKTHGIILVTGPTGSGKSTTLYAGLMKINGVERNVITVEDPVENRIHGIGQIQVNSKIGLNFADGLRAILRQDPDVIMIGEIRDLETAEIAINASLTGHLVLSTIHTNDAAGAIPRLVDMGCEPFLISSSLLGIIAQRLIRLLCDNCKEPYTLTDEDIKELEITRETADSGKVCKAVGCAECNQKGYKGRCVISEFLLVTDEVRRLILQRKDGNTIKKEARAKGMKTIREDGVQKILEGSTTIEEVLSNSQVDD